MVVSCRSGLVVLQKNEAYNEARLRLRFRRRWAVRLTSLVLLPRAILRGYVHGKSGVVDAIEFALTGKISRLAGADTGGLSDLEQLVALCTDNARPATSRR